MYSLTQEKALFWKAEQKLEEEKARHVCHWGNNVAGGAANLLNEPCSRLITEETAIEEIGAQGKDDVQLGGSL